MAKLHCWFYLFVQTSISVLVISYDNRVKLFWVADYCNIESNEKVDKLSIMRFNFAFCWPDQQLCKTWIENVSLKLTGDVDLHLTKLWLKQPQIRWSEVKLRILACFSYFCYVKNTLFDEHLLRTLMSPERNLWQNPSLWLPE
jgi:hypothetical protein